MDDRDILFSQLMSSPSIRSIFNHISMDFSKKIATESFLNGDNLSRDEIYKQADEKAKEYILENFT